MFKSILYKFSFLLFILLISSSSVFTQITDSYFYERKNNEDIDPRSIVKVSDNGYIISGIEQQGSSFIMKVDSTNEIDEYLLLNNQWGNLDVYSENLQEFTDSTYLLIHGPWDPDLSKGFLSFYEFDENLNIKQELSLDIGFDPKVLNSIQLADYSHLIAVTGDKNLIISINTLFQINWIKEFSNENKTFKLKKLNIINDSLLFISAYDQESIIFSTLSPDCEIINSIETSNNDSYLFDSDVYLEKDTIFLLYTRELKSSGDGCHLLKMNFDLEKDNEYFYWYEPSYFMTPSNVGFMSIDSLGFSFYAGNTLYKSNRDHKVINSISGGITFKDFYTDNETTSILVKNGFIPAKSVNSGYEFVILKGNSIDSIMTSNYENKCLGFPYVYIDPYEVTIQYESYEYFVDTFSTVILNDSYDFNAAGINLFDSCPDAPSLISSKFNTPEINVYPNPASDFLNVESDYIMETIIISSGDGRIINTFPSINMNNYSIDMCSAIEGMYFISVMIDNRWTTQKFIVHN